MNGIKPYQYWMNKAQENNTRPTKYTGAKMGQAHLPTSSVNIHYDAIDMLLDIALPVVEGTVA